MCDSCEWSDLKDKIDEMLDDDGKYDWAEETLNGILGWITEKEHCTDKQKEAVDNIENARSRDDR